MKLIDLLVKELPKRGGWPEGVAAMAQDADGAVQNYSDTFDIIINDEFAHGNSRIASSYSIDAGECGIATDRLTAIITRSQYEAAIAKNDGWIEWGGGECPVDGESIVDVKQRDNWTSEGDAAKCWKWNHVGDYADIIAYRLHKPDINSRANDDRLEQDLDECIGQGVDMPEWSGEGLPPVGVKCQVRVGRDNYEDCLVLYSGEHGCAFTYLGDNGDKHSIDCVSKHAAHDYFRPLRTEAGKAREETIGAIRKLLDAGVSNVQDAIDIYEAIAAGKIHGIKLEGK